MLMHTRWMNGMAALVLAGALAAPAAAGVAYKWTDASGAVSFTDDADRIPKQFRDSAEKIETGPLSDYGQLSPARVETEAHLAAVEERTERLREINEQGGGQIAVAAPAAAGAIAGAPGFTSTIDVGGSTIRIPPTNPANGPVIVERVRTVKDGGNITQTATVVRQGDEVLMVVYPDQQNERDIPRGDEIFSPRD